MTHYLYIHGLGSSPRSTKVRFFAERLAVRSLALSCPDLNEPDFSTLTVTRMLARVEQELAELPEGPVVLIGSSLGGLVAVLAAERRAAAGRAGSAETSHPVERMILLAPALNFWRSRTGDLGEEELARWREAAWIDVFHYSYGEIRPIHYALYEDAQRYDPLVVTAAVPTLIFQGRQDTLVEPAVVAEFARGRSHVTLCLLDDDHQLLASLEEIWRRSAGFLGLAE